MTIYIYEEETKTWENVLFGMHLRQCTTTEEGKTKGAETLANYQRHGWQLLFFKALELKQ